MFQLSEINQVEREIYQYLEQKLNIDLVTLHEFEDMVKKDFIGQGLYLTCILLFSSTTSSMLPPSTNLFSSLLMGMITTPSYGPHF